MVVSEGTRSHNPLYPRPLTLSPVKTNITVISHPVRCVACEDFSFSFVVFGWSRAPEAGGASLEAGERGDAVGPGVGCGQDESSRRWPRR